MADNDERVEHGQGGPKPADLGDTTGEGITNTEVDVVSDDVTGIGRRRVTETEQRDDQEQPTAATPRPDRGHFDPTEHVDANVDNPSDPSSYDNDDA